MRILGVDPGSRLTGYGCIDLAGSQLQLVTHGTLKLARTGGRQETPLEDRLLSIYNGLTDVIAQHRPKILVVERAFFAKNAESALKLGQARGAVILTGAIHGLEIAEYSPSEVKQSVVGHGQADKDQVARMVQLVLGAQKFTSSDASDGLALAICHAYATRAESPARAILAEAARGRRGGRRRGGSLAEAVGLVPPRK
jgi:crossover junction endodeoxyribonuclease RuvC